MAHTDFSLTPAEYERDKRTRIDEIKAQNEAYANSRKEKARDRVNTFREDRANALNENRSAKLSDIHRRLADADFRLNAANAHRRKVKAKAQRIWSVFLYLSIAFFVVYLWDWACGGCNGGNEPLGIHSWCAANEAAVDSVLSGTFLDTAISSFIAWFGSLHPLLGLPIGLAIIALNLVMPGTIVSLVYYLICNTAAASKIRAAERERSRINGEEADLNSDVLRDEAQDEEDANEFRAEEAQRVKRELRERDEKCRNEIADIEADIASYKTDYQKKSAFIAKTWRMRLGNQEEDEADGALKWAVLSIADVISAAEARHVRTVILNIDIWLPECIHVDGVKEDRMQGLRIRATDHNGKAQGVNGDSYDYIAMADKLRPHASQTIDVYSYLTALSELLCDKLGDQLAITDADMCYEGRLALRYERTL